MNNFNRIPSELKALHQFTLWRYEDVGASKPTKIPYTRNHRKLSVTNPDDWLSFTDVINIYNLGGYDGIGFVFSQFDPYAFIDLDATQDKDSIDRQLKIYKEFDSYSEKSPSGKGLHIIIKGSIPQGRKRSDIELYSSERYATMTGDVYNDKGIEERHNLLNMLFNDMSKPPKTIYYNGDDKETQSDQEIIETARNAINGAKFIQLYSGEWQSLYKSQSEADYSLINMFTFYTQNTQQIYRLFLSSALGQRDKAKRWNDYIGPMITKSFDQLPPKMDFDGFRIQLEDQLALPLNGSVVQSIEPAAHNGQVTGSSPVASTINQSTIQPPPGLVGEIARFIYEAAPRPVPEIALAGAMGLMAGICGRAYNISGTGLNQYILCLAMTGAGKEAMASGIDKIINEVQKQVPVASEFVGPSEIQSGQALIKNLSEQQSYVSLLGEFGLRLKALSSDRANSAEIALRRMLLDLYNKSGHGQVIRPTIYSDKAKNIAAISSPAFSILGESTPERFYEVLTEEMISEGLLPRFMLIEYKGERPALNENAINILPNQLLTNRVAELMAYAKTTMANRKVVNIVSTNEADEMLRQFDKFADRQINTTDKEIIRQLWNRAHIKVLKIAGTLAVGINYSSPLIEIEHVEWAKRIVENDIKTLSDKFVAGIIGKSSEELKQLQEIKRMIKLFVTIEWDKIKMYCNDQRLYVAKIIPYAYLNKRLSNVSAFKQDKLGATNSLKRAIQILIDSDYMREASKKEMLDKFGTTQRAFVITSMSMLE